MPRGAGLCARASARIEQTEILSPDGDARAPRLILRTTFFSVFAGTSFT
jgi:hypothetical protein